MAIERIRKKLITLLLLTSLAAAVHAGDVARFTNLGFSPDSQVFVFSQHGIEGASGHPYAEVFTVDVPGNVFVREGVAQQVFTQPVSAGQDGSGALFNVLRDLAPMMTARNVNHLRQGRLIYLSLNQTEPTPRVEFRDFQQNSRYTISVTQESRGSGREGSAAFHLDITLRTADGTTVQRRVGRPGFFRDGVNRYSVGQVILAPDGESLVVVMERITDIPGGRQIRYMVETVRLR